MIFVPYELPPASSVPNKPYKGPLHVRVASEKTTDSIKTKLAPNSNEQKDFSTDPSSGRSAKSVAVEYSAENLFSSFLLNARMLTTGPLLDRSLRHSPRAWAAHRAVLEVELFLGLAPGGPGAPASLGFQPGDSFSILPPNPAALVNSTLALFLASHNNFLRHSDAEPGAVAFLNENSRILIESLPPHVLSAREKEWLETRKQREKQRGNEVEKEVEDDEECPSLTLREILTHRVDLSSPPRKLALVQLLPFFSRHLHSHGDTRESERNARERNVLSLLSWCVSKEKRGKDLWNSLERANIDLTDLLLLTHRALLPPNGDRDLHKDVSGDSDSGLVDGLCVPLSVLLSLCAAARPRLYSAASSPLALSTIMEKREKAVENENEGENGEKEGEKEVWVRSVRLALTLERFTSRHPRLHFLKEGEKEVELAEKEGENEGELRCREGLCSSYLMDLSVQLGLLPTSFSTSDYLSPGFPLAAPALDNSPWPAVPHCVRLFVKSSPHFRPPPPPMPPASSPVATSSFSASATPAARPLILICAGTGIAPFMSFLHHRSLSRGVRDPAAGTWRGLELDNNEYSNSSSILSSSCDRIDDSAVGNGAWLVETDEKADANSREKDVVKEVVKEVEGEVHVFQGCRGEGDRLYAPEMRALLNRGLVREHAVALSREGDCARVTRLLARKETRRWFAQMLTQRAATVMVCGSAEMARDVSAIIAAGLREVEKEEERDKEGEEEEELSKDEVEELLADLKRKKRILIDAWG